MIFSRLHAKFARMRDAAKQITRLGFALDQKVMNSPRLGGRGRTSARGTPRVGTPVGGMGSFATPAPKGSLTLGKGKGRLRSGMDATPTGMGLDQSNNNNMLMSREASYDIGGADVDLLHSRIGSFQPAGKAIGEKGRIFAKSEEMTVSFHEIIPVDIIRAMGLDGEFRSNLFSRLHILISR
jgi:hypothetical protein